MKVPQIPWSDPGIVLFKEIGGLRRFYRGFSADHASLIGPVHPVNVTL
ncbi:MAG: hypothetical protein ACXWDN_13275 [Limisphaerales bacterium]